MTGHPKQWDKLSSLFSTYYHIHGSYNIKSSIKKQAGHEKYKSSTQVNVHKIYKNYVVRAKYGEGVHVVKE